MTEPGPGEVRVRTLVSGISRGTERLVAGGLVPLGQRQRMRCPFQAGEFPFPVKYGYAAVGFVEAGPEALLGQRVFCLHPHQDAFVVPATAVVPVPPRVPTARAVLAANMETALNAAWDAPLLPGMRVVVVGAGVVGCLAARLAASTPGTAVTLVDHDATRAGIASVLGITFALPGAATGGADLVIEASGDPAALPEALRLAGEEATVLVLSWYGAAVAALPLGEAFHDRRLRLVASQVGAVAPAMRPRWPLARRLALAMALLDDPALDALLGQSVPFTGLPGAMHRLVGAGAEALCPLVTYAREG